MMTSAVTSTRGHGLLNSPVTAASMSARKTCGVFRTTWFSPRASGGGSPVRKAQRLDIQDRPPPIGPSPDSTPSADLAPASGGGTVESLGSKLTSWNGPAEPLGRTNPAGGHQPHEVL